ncbi:hypothetical protein Btru_044200 [Bulinus truncatus]|nr:hypothetical protein Btru_044200 [Bulinus truncatus]
MVLELFCFMTDSFLSRAEVQISPTDPFDLDPVPNDIDKNKQLIANVLIQRLQTFAIISNDTGLRGTYDGDSQGTYDGDSQGTYDGDSQGTYDGDSQGTYDGDSQGTYDGDFRGTYDGDSQGTYDGDSRCCSLASRVSVCVCDSVELGRRRYIGRGAAGSRATRFTPDRRRLNSENVFLVLGTEGWSVSTTGTAAVVGKDQLSLLHCCDVDTTLICDITYPEIFILISQRVATYPSITRSIWSHPTPPTPSRRKTLTLSPPTPPAPPPPPCRRRSQRRLTHPPNARHDDRTDPRLSDPGHPPDPPLRPPGAHRGGAPPHAPAHIHQPRLNPHDAPAPRHPRAACVN